MDAKLGASMRKYNKMARSSASSTVEASSTPIANWKAEIMEEFIDICISHLDDRGSSRFLTVVQTDFNNRFDDDLSQTQMKNKWDNLKRLWRDWNALLQIPGGQWDVENVRLDGSEEWWFGPARQFQKYRRNPPPKFRELDEMFGGCIRKGTYRVSIVPFSSTLSQSRCLAPFPSSTTPAACLNYRRQRVVNKKIAHRNPKRLECYFWMILCTKSYYGYL